MNASAHTMSALRAVGTKPALGPAAVLLSLSGASALIFQILWIKQLSIIVGVEVHAIALAISAFFFGLATGSWYLGRWADSVKRPFRSYMWIELAIAALGVAVTLALAHGVSTFSRIHGFSSWLGWLAVIGVVGITPFFMGGTLPILLRAAGAGQLGRAGATLYAANTAGAIVGALLPAFVLIPALGVKGSACAAAGLNLLAALGAFALNRYGSPDVVDVQTGKRSLQPREMPRQAWLALLLYGVAGAIAMGYEVLWSQMVVPFMSTRAFAFSIVLAVYLAGLAGGAALYRRFEHRLGDPWCVFGFLVAGAGLVALVETAILGRWVVGAQSVAEATIWRWTDSGLAGMSARFAVIAGAVVLLPTLLLGAAFPAVLRIVVPKKEPGRGTGAVLAANTMGGIVGTALTGFLILPYLGTMRGLGLLAIAACCVGVAAMWLSRQSSGTVRGLALAITGAAVVLGVSLPTDHLARLLPGAQSGKLVFYEESHGGTVAVVEQGSGEKRFRRLYIHGVSNSGDAMPSLRYMRLQALLPIIIHAGTPKSALVIGFGTGITAGALSRYPGLERKVVAELSPSVLHAAHLFKGSYGAATDPGLQRRVRDGRRELLGSADRYDLITLEPPPPSAAGVVNLYSRDFYALAASRLNSRGIVAQWLPLPTQNLEDSRALVASFIEVFPYASLWSTELHEMMLVGSMDPLPLDPTRIAKRYAEPEVSAALAEVGIDSPAALLATWITDRNGLAHFAGAVPAVTDDRPVIEYAAWVRPKEILRTLPALLKERTDIPLEDPDEKLLFEVGRERDFLHLFYRSALAAYRGDREAWSHDAAALMQTGHNNPYLQWFTGR